MVDKLQQVFVGKRKTAIARLRVRPGSGRIYINNMPYEHFFSDVFAREKAVSPLYLDEEFWKKHDFYVKIRGGGPYAVADAVAIAIARAMVAANENDKEKIVEFNRVLLAGDPRRTEPKKPMRYSARRFRQKSYR